MSVVKLELENIGVFRGRKEFTLSKGLNVLYAPNASGKTSLVAGLKAVTISALSPEELGRVLNDYEERGSVRLVVDGSEYFVELVRRPDGRVEARGKRLAENGAIKKVAFLDLENSLVNAIYAGDAERVKQELEEITGVRHIETIVEILEGLKRGYEFEYETKRREYESKREEIETQLKDVEERLRTVGMRINEILRNPRIEFVRKEIEVIRSERERLEKELSKYRSEEIRLSNEITSYESEQRGLRAQIEVYKEKYAKLAAERDEISKRNVEFRKRIESLEEEIRSLTQLRDKLFSELREKEDMLKRRKMVSGYAQCPYCGAPIDRDKIESEIAKLESEITGLSDWIVRINEEIERKKAEIDELRREGEERLKAIEKEMESLANRITELEGHISSIERNLSILRHRLAEIEKEIESLKEQISILDKKLELLRKESPDVVDLIEELKRLLDEESRLVERRDYLRGRLAQLEQLYKEVIVLRERVETADLLLKYFRIRLNELRRAVVEKINESVLRHFKLLSLAELEYPVLAEDFTLTLVRSGGVPTSLAELSDAEKAIFAILMALALKDFVAGDFPFYVVDTLIEFMDDARAREVMRYLMEEAGAGKVVIVTKTKPYAGEPRLLSQEDIVVNEIP